MSKIIEQELIKVPEEDKSLCFLYKTLPGRVMLQLLTARWLSKLAGQYLDSSFSKWIIKPFVKKNNICLSDYEDCEYANFNEFFCRKIKKELRPVDVEVSHLTSPCDGLLSVYPIHEGLVIPVKHSRYGIEDLLQDKELAKQFEDGLCFVFRLCVNHYHRYCFPDRGTIEKTKKIAGKLHTVQPIALRKVPVFTENSREYAVLQTENFGTVIQMEVGAMLVGKISNHEKITDFSKGQEKGCFLYGGSTIIMLIQKNQITIPEWFQKSQSDEYEIPVKFGQYIGTSGTL